MFWKNETIVTVTNARTFIPTQQATELISQRIFQSLSDISVGKENQLTIFLYSAPIEEDGSHILYIHN